MASCIIWHTVACPCTCHYVWGFQKPDSFCQVPQWRIFAPVLWGAIGGGQNLVMWPRSLLSTWPSQSAWLSAGTGYPEGLFICSLQCREYGLAAGASPPRLPNLCIRDLRTGRQAAWLYHCSCRPTRQHGGRQVLCLWRDRCWDRSGSYWGKGQPVALRPREVLLHPPMLYGHQPGRVRVCSLMLANRRGQEGSVQAKCLLAGSRNAHVGNGR